LNVEVDNVEVDKDGTPGYNTVAEYAPYSALSGLNPTQTDSLGGLGGSMSVSAPDFTHHRAVGAL
jgi:hypothetical protein